MYPMTVVHSAQAVLLSNFLLIEDENASFALPTHHAPERRAMLTGLTPPPEANSNSKRLSVVFSSA